MRAVLQRLLSESSFSIAAGFSGGLDSSIVAAIVAQCGYRVHTYGLFMSAEFFYIFPLRFTSLLFGPLPYQDCR
ncbi:asparagine synthase-related protein [Prodigiosinella confusarubida]|uniref:asparagine synthase-related protein n=1 Tax=Serratia sp. (strain ATCC 39006) TaxID=104623 RepID=UPI003A5B9E7C